MCPLSTGGRTRRVQLVQGEEGGVGGCAQAMSTVLVQMPGTPLASAPAPEGNINIWPANPRRRPAPPPALRTHGAMHVTVVTPPPSPCTNWTRIVLPPVLSGHVSSFPPY